MKTTTIAGAAFALGAAIPFVLASSSGAIDQLISGARAPYIARPFPSNSEIARTNKTATGQPIEIPARPDVIATLTTIPAGGATQVHKHPYQRFVYVLAGNLRVVDMTTGEKRDY